MASKNHALDSEIIRAAQAEFLRLGYEKASLRKIASEAGVTVGALYTRYHNKDSLFCSLVQPLLSRIEESFCTLKQEYYAENSCSPIQSMKKESELILHLLFDDYDRAVLLLCRSRGSSLEHYFDVIVQRKTEESLNYFRTLPQENLSEAMLRLLIRGQFYMYFQIIHEGYDLETARRMMNAVMAYHTAGWLSLMQGKNNEQEGQK